MQWRRTPSKKSNITLILYGMKRKMFFLLSVSCVLIIVAAVLKILHFNALVATAMLAFAAIGVLVSGVFLLVHRIKTNANPL